MKVRCIDSHNKENLIIKGKEYLVKSIGIGKYVIVNNLGSISCIDKRRFEMVEE